MTAPKDPRRLLARLIGPAGPELSCEECFEQLDRYVELELAGAERADERAGGSARADERVPGMRAHLEGCPACREDYESLREYVSARGREAD
jgi:hypothetical protein